VKPAWLRCALLLGAVSIAAAPPPALGPVRSQFGVMIPMRDGVALAADLWLPEAPGRYPVLLARTPYMKTGLGLSKWAHYFASRGYVVALQDTRGRGDSVTRGPVGSRVRRTAAEDRPRSAQPLQQRHSQRHSVAKQWVKNEQGAHSSRQAVLSAWVQQTQVWKIAPDRGSGTAAVAGG